MALHKGTAVMSNQNTRDFVIAYFECALWSSTEWDEEGNAGEPLDANYGIDDIHPVTKRAGMRDCISFVTVYGDLLDQVGDYASHGHDFWLTRNHHGAGFWDRGYEEIGEQLTKAAKGYGRADMIASEGKVYHE